MNKKTFFFNFNRFLFILVLLSLILLLNSVSAAECNPAALVEDCTLNASTTYILNPATYTFNDSNNNGVVGISGANTTLDCNGTTFDGNWSGESVNSRPFNPTGLNTTLKNCIIQDYRIVIQINTNITTINNFTVNHVDKAIQFQGGTIVNSTIVNSRFNNITTNVFNANSILGGFTNLSYNLMTNLSSRAFFSANLGSTGIIYSYNNITQYLGNTNMNVFNGDTSPQIFNNYLSSNGGTGTDGFNFARGTGANFYNNTVEYTEAGITFSVMAANHTFHENIFRNNDKGMYLSGVNNITVSNNQFINNTANYDGYDAGLKIKNSTNIFITNNNFTEVTSTALFAMKVKNITITGNTIDMVQMPNRSNYSSTDYGDPACAISLVELYKSYIGDGEEVGDGAANITLLTTYKSDNVTITGNTITHSQCLLRTEGTTNLIHDLTGYSYYRFQTPDYLKDIMEFYLPSGFNNLSSFYANSGANKINNTILSTYNLGAINSKFKIYFSVFQDYLYFKNVNDTVTYYTNISNQSNALIYLSNGTGMICTGVCNFSLTPKNYSYVLDNYTFGEGVTSRTYDPLWLISKNQTISGQGVQTDVYHIGSNITVLLQITLDASTNCRDLSAISITPKNAAVYTPSYSCSGSTITITNTQLNPSTDSNVITVTYNANVASSCAATQNFFVAVIPIIEFILTILLIAAVIGILMSHFGVLPDIEIGSSLELSTLMGALVIVTSASLLITFVIYMFESGLCPALGG